ncbi:polyphosphate kinase [Mucilaginibacter yixingensis]|uniref:Polyphosphate kinase n=1 Tax=Mucilaginibacter yixingensis TaxID=1295612 RepID=A0A2T5J5L6_9SPHI|nr:polyphosphate kinase 1 [Mucilaginibacter yixingensis]PTQ93556.1 polyphosphate kinase [Mucilaginibacter yixingensis]
MAIEEKFFNRDLSWLYFNSRVLEEAANPQVPILERFRFLGIFSSNLDEFYRVRMPVLKALQKISEKDDNNIDFDEQTANVRQAEQIVMQQQKRFGQVLTTELLPLLEAQNIHLLYNKDLPDELRPAVDEYFLTDVLAYLQPQLLTEDSGFFPENNQLYFIVQALDADGKEKVYILHIPSEVLPRFYSININDRQFIIFLDDIICFNINRLFPGLKVAHCYSFKITRDAELDLNDEYGEDLSDQLEKQLSKRDLGKATRFLFQQGMPLRLLETLRSQFNMQKANAVEGGRYHNMKDLGSLPIKISGAEYDRWTPLKRAADTNRTMAQMIAEEDIIIHTPYHSYQSVLRFFNEAANNPDVEEIYITLYRVASDSRIVNALISAAKNGKKVQVVVELKARFDEANNLKWAKKMKDAGVKIIYSVTALKIHAKVGLIKTRHGNRMVYTGLLATGNFNEGTARFYTDHVLFTADKEILREVELLFIFLARREKPSPATAINFEQILVAQFNLQQRFMAMIDREIAFARQGKPAHIRIKLNNLEEQVLIKKLYEASQAGVKIELIVRSICCLIPGVPGMSENITIKRIVDRYLEHGRVFMFSNDGNKEVYLGSADWMNRNIHHRIEVCFPVKNVAIKQELIQMLDLQWHDNRQAVWLNSQLQNVPVEHTEPAISSQQAIYELLKKTNR